MKHFLLRQTKRLANCSFFTTYWLEYLIYAHSRDRTREPLIVYQMGKVGSSSVVDSLNHLRLDMEVFQVHVLTREWIRKVNGQYRDASKTHGRPMVDEHLLASRYLRHMIDKFPTKHRWKVITMVRDPVAKNISAFFEAFPIYFPHEAQELKRSNLTVADKVTLLVDLFLTRFERHDVPLTWFDTHMRPVFNIDVFSEVFNYDKGYHIYRGENADLLLLRLEDLDRCSRQGFKEFLNVDNFVLRDRNVSADKEYAPAYALFKKTVSLPERYVSRIYSSKLMLHFYSENERAALLEKWAAKR